MRIAAASCAKLQDVNFQPVWAAIQNEKPDVLLLVGDQIYLDQNNHSNPQRLQAELNGLYKAQLAERHFAALLADMKTRGKQVLAIYDDHDFLGNNRYGADHDLALAEAARNELIAAFSPPMTGSDVYSISSFGLVDIVVLDERFYRKAALHENNDRNAILGLKQWQWFEGVVAASRSEYLLVASSTKVHFWRDETWEGYPAAFERLRKLVKDRRGAFVLSGDIHKNDVYGDSGIIELVTSGVARKGERYDQPRQNHAILDFDVTHMHVDLRSLDVSGRFKFSIPLADWRLP